MPEAAPASTSLNPPTTLTLPWVAAAVFGLPFLLGAPAAVAVDEAAVAERVALADADGTAADWSSEFGNLPTGKQAHVRVAQTAQDLRANFDRWTEGAQRLPARGPKIPDVYKLEDGTVMQWRVSSKSGGATIDIFREGEELKVHLP